MADLIAALVVAVFLVKQQRVGAAFRNTDAVIVAVYRGEVADEEKIMFFTLCFLIFLCHSLSSFLCLFFCF